MAPVNHVLATYGAPKSLVHVLLDPLDSLGSVVLTLGPPVVPFYQLFWGRVPLLK